MRESAPARDFASLWQGIYDFPFRLSNLKAYMIVTLCLICSLSQSSDSPL